MGRQYATELFELDATYEWAINAPVEELSESVALSAQHPLVAVGSGGSLTTAHFAGLLHGCFTGQPTQILTPYELVTSPQCLIGSAVLFCSAGGSNPDVVIAAEQILKRLPIHLFAITTKLGSPLQGRLEEFIWPKCHAFETPTRKDGFLATNSLLASLVLLTKAYETWAKVPTCLPATLDQLVHPGLTRSVFLERFNSQLAPVINQATIIVLYGSGTKPAAMDVESRLTEAALASVQLSDFRNFAHGRHHWLARHSETSSVLAICQNGDEIASRTLSLLPISIPSWQISVEPGIPGALAAVYQSMLLAHVAGAAKSIDPGRPHVPTFGRKLYHLKAMPTLFPRANAPTERMNLAIERKARGSITRLELSGRVDIWKQHYRAFVNRLAKARILGVVLDYDGTLCAPQKRFDGISDLIAKRINDLVEKGLIVAVATGRGQSVRKALLQHITCVENQARIIIGYHNGAEIAPLNDPLSPPAEQPLATELISIAEDFRANDLIYNNATIVAKSKQISLEFLPGANVAMLIQEANRVFRYYQNSGAILTTSSHSLDIVAPGVNKIAVVKFLANRLSLPNNGNDSILCIGDRGRPPGNDADLLTHPLSLSVDEVSDDSSTCWSIAKPGLRFDLACLEYLMRLQPEKGGFRFDTRGVQP